MVVVGDVDGDGDARQAGWAGDRLAKGRWCAGLVSEANACTTLTAACTQAGNVSSRYKVRRSASQCSALSLSAHVK